MTDVRRLAMIALVAATVVVALVVGNPGGGDPAPASAGPAEAADAVATTEEFCAAFEDFAAAHATAIESTSTDTVVSLRESATATLEVGLRTPELATSARQGLEFIVGLFETIPDDATTESLYSSEQQPTVTEQARATDFADFLNTECFGSGGPGGTSGPEGGDEPTAVPTS